MTAPCHAMQMQSLVRMLLPFTRCIIRRLPLALLLSCQSVGPALVLLHKLTRRPLSLLLTIVMGVVVVVLLLLNALVTSIVLLPQLRWVSAIRHLRSVLSLTLCIVGLLSLTDGHLDHLARYALIHVSLFLLASFDCTNQAHRWIRNPPSRNVYQWRTGHLGNMLLLTSRQLRTVVVLLHVLHHRGRRVL